MLSRLPSRRLLSTAAAASPTSHKPHNLSPTPKSRPPKINHVFPPSPSDIASHIPISNYFDENLLRLRAEAAHRRLSEKGTKPEVVERLEKHDAHRGASPYLHNKMRIVRNKLSPKALRRYSPPFSLSIFPQLTSPPASAPVNSLQNRNLHPTSLVGT
ncbi:hypothetical protein BDD12DRAFT_133123 [Trichophaea hybrida]|nr:hypothetical protein BDD12DRAFT_133123 [Trichophaea hybrida]